MAANAERERKMRIRKSTRHAKITGDFGEMAVLYWLSKYGCSFPQRNGTGVLSMLSQKASASFSLISATAANSATSAS
jgi:hypothetical protein